MLGAKPLIRGWIYVTLAASIVAALDGGWLYRWASLWPSRIWRGEVWRLVTWPFVETGPLALVITCVSIYKFGGELAVRWGERRLRRFMVEVLAVAGIAACVVGAIAGGGHFLRCGGWVATDVLVIAWARQFPTAGLRLYGVLEVRGERLVAISVAMGVLSFVYFGVSATPELVAAVVAATYPRRRLEAI
jgi:membrane associated rhomboid family serine protease